MRSGGKRLTKKGYFRIKILILLIVSILMLARYRYVYFWVYEIGKLGDLGGETVNFVPELNREDCCGNKEIYKQYLSEKYKQCNNGRFTNEVYKVQIRSINISHNKRERNWFSKCADDIEAYSCPKDISIIKSNKENGVIAGRIRKKCELFDYGTSNGHIIHGSGGVGILSYNKNNKYITVLYKRFGDDDEVLLVMVGCRDERNFDELVCEAERVFWAIDGKVPADE